jgi:hypothetical protein
MYNPPFGGFFVGRTEDKSDRSSMSNDIGGWFDLAIVAGRLILLALERAGNSRRRSRRRERFRSFRAWGIEWTAYDRDDDRQS